MYPVCKLRPLFLFVVCLFSLWIGWMKLLRSYDFQNNFSRWSWVITVFSTVFHTDVCKAYWVRCARHKILQLDLNPDVIKSHPFWLDALQVVLFFCFFVWRVEFAKIFHMYDTHNHFFLLNRIQRKTRKSRYVREYWIMFGKNVSM